MKKILFLTLLVMIFCLSAAAQPSPWLTGRRTNDLYPSQRVKGDLVVTNDLSVLGHLYLADGTEVTGSGGGGGISLGTMNTAIAAQGLRSTNYTDAQTAALGTALTNAIGTGGSMLPVNSNQLSTNGGTLSIGTGAKLTNAQASATFNFFKSGTLKAITRIDTDGISLESAGGGGDAGGKIWDFTDTTNKWVLHIPLKLDAGISGDGSGLTGIPTQAAVTTISNTVTANTATINANSNDLVNLKSFPPNIIAGANITATTTNGTNVIVSTGIGTNLFYSGTNVAVNASGYSYFRLTATNSFLLQNPTGGSDGQRVIFEVLQDGTGSRTMAMDSKFSFGSGITSVTLSTAANKRDFIGAIYNVITDKWYVVAVQQGY